MGHGDRSPEGPIERTLRDGVLFYEGLITVLSNCTNVRILTNNCAKAVAPGARLEAVLREPDQNRVMRGKGDYADPRANTGAMREGRAANQ